MNHANFRNLVLGLALVAVASCATTKEEVKPVQTAPVVAAPPPEPTAEEHLAAGIQALKAKDLATAKEKLGKAAAKNPKLFAAHYNLGFIAQSE